MNTIHAVVFDADGMLVHGERFSSRLQRIHGIPTTITGPFFSTRFQECLVGKVDLRESLPEYLPAWGWKGDAESLLRFWFEEEYHAVDARFFPIIKRLRKKGLITSLATNNEKYRTAHLVDACGLGKLFDRVCSSADFGCKKPEADFFFKVAHALGADPETISFWDDDPDNVAGAAKAGFQANLYQDFSAFCEHFQAHLC